MERLLLNLYIMFSKFFINRILAWAMGEGYSVIPSSTKRENLESNLKAQNLQLDAEDKKAIAALDCNDRLVSPEGLAPEWD